MALDLHECTNLCHSDGMKQRLLPIFMVFGGLLGIVGESFALPKCPGSPTHGRPSELEWTNCVGIHYSYGREYSGEYQNGQPNGEGYMYLYPTSLTEAENRRRLFGTT